MIVKFMTLPGLPESMATISESDLFLRFTAQAIVSRHAGARKKGFTRVWLDRTARGVHEITAIHSVQDVANLELPIGRSARAYARDDVEPRICTTAGRGRARPAVARAGALRPLAPGKRGTATLRGRRHAETRTGTPASFSKAMPSRTKLSPLRSRRLDADSAPPSGTAGHARTQVPGPAAGCVWRPQPRTGPGCLEESARTSSRSRGAA